MQLVWGVTVADEQVEERGSKKEGEGDKGNHKKLVKTNQSKEASMES